MSGGLRPAVGRSVSVVNDTRPGADAPFAGVVDFVTVRNLAEEAVVLQRVILDFSATPRFRPVIQRLLPGAQDSPSRQILGAQLTDYRRHGRRPALPNGK